MKQSWAVMNAFESYLSLGPARSISRLAEVSNYSRVTLLKWSKEFRWDQRVLSRDEKMLAEIEKENDRALKDAILIRHREGFKAVQEKVIGQIENYTPKKGAIVSAKDLKDAAVALQVSVDGERKALGMEGSKIRAASVKDGVANLLEVVFQQ